MAKGLKSLIRLNKWKVDEKRRALADKLDQVAALEEQLTALDHELIREQSSAQQSPQEAGLFYGSYANGVIERREQFHSGIQDMEAQIITAQDELNETYRELKKFEVINKQREIREADERAKKEQEMLDELGLQNHQRNSD